MIIIRIFLFIHLLLNQFQLLIAQNHKLDISLDGKVYTITGDNLTIVIGQNLSINIEQKVPEKVRKSIETKYQKKIDLYERKYKSGLLSLQEWKNEKEKAKSNYYVAQNTAEKLAKEFSKVNFAAESYLYRLAYVLYKEGDIDAAQLVLNQENLDLNESCQAMQYLLVIATKWSQGVYDEAFRYLEKVIKKYPSLNTYASFGDYLQYEERYEEAINKYIRASSFEPGKEDKIYLDLQISFCRLISGRLDSARQNKFNLSSPKNDLCYFPPPCRLEKISRKTVKANLIQAYNIVNSSKKKAKELLNSIRDYYESNQNFSIQEATLYWSLLIKSSDGFKSQEASTIALELNNLFYRQSFITNLSKDLTEVSYLFLSEQLLNLRKYAAAGTYVQQILPELAFQSKLNENALNKYFEVLTWKLRILKELNQKKEAKSVRQLLKKILREFPENTRLSRIYEKV